MMSMVTNDVDAIDLMYERNEDWHDDVAMYRQWALCMGWL